MLTFFARGKPKAQPRVKATRRGAFAGVYDPGTANDWKTTVKAACLASWDGRQIMGPTKVCIAVSFDRPKKHYKGSTLRQEAPSYHITKPDAENCSKAILDALTDLGVWKDDSQVCDVRTVKQYAVAETGAQITITEL